MTEIRMPTLAALLARHSRTARGCGIAASVTLVPRGAPGFAVAPEADDARDPEHYLHMDLLRREGEAWASKIDSALGTDGMKVSAPLPMPARLPQKACVPDIGRILRQAAPRISPDVFDRLGGAIAFPIQGHSRCDHNAVPLPAPMHWQPDPALTHIITDLTQWEGPNAQGLDAALVLNNLSLAVIDTMCAHQDLFKGAVLVDLRLRITPPTAHERMSAAARSSIAVG